MEPQAPTGVVLADVRADSTPVWSTQKSRVLIADWPTTQSPEYNKERAGRLAAAFRGPFVRPFSRDVAPVIPRSAPS